MRLGFGTTVLERGMSQGHMDGIGVYAGNLWNALDKVQKRAVTFGDPPSTREIETRLDNPAHITLPYPLQSARSIVTGMPFAGMKRLEEEIDLFFAPDHHIPKLDHTPVIATIMDAYPLIYPRRVSRRLRYFKNFAFKRASHWAEHIITISEYSKRDISNYFEIADEKISVIPLGVDETFFERIDRGERERVCRKYGLEEGFFLFVGTIQPRKNLSGLIRAYESLPERIKKRHALLIIGHYGWGEDVLWKNLTLEHTYRTIHHLQDISDHELRTLLQSALALVYPSFYEGFGLPILEGFASEIPVITSSTSSIPEVAADAAVYIDPEDPRDIARGMMRLLQDPGLQKEMVARGKLRAREYSWKRSAQKHRALFERFC